MFKFFFFLSIGEIFSQALRQGKNVVDYSQVSFVNGIFLPELGKIDRKFTLKFILITNEKGFPDFNMCIFL